MLFRIQSINLLRFVSDACVYFYPRKNESTEKPAELIIKENNHLRNGLSMKSNYFNYPVNLE